MIRVKFRDGSERTFADKLMPNVCLQLCGGGYSTSQTARAMTLQSELAEKKAANLKGIVITVEEES